MTKTLQQRFDEKWVVDEDGCHIWTAAKDKDGYGVFGQAGGPRSTRAHRWSYQRAKGPIPEGMVLDHLCRKRACTRVECLEVVTVQENTLRGETLAAANAAKTHCKKGHPYDEVNTHRSKGERVCKVCKADNYKRWYDKHGLARYHANKAKKR